MEALLETMSEDDAAMCRVAAGDNSALAELFDRHKAQLYGFLYHILGDRSAAEDLVGETFLRVYRARGRYRGGSGFVAWLFTIARNLALGELRRRGVAHRAHERLTREAPADAETWDAGQVEMRERVWAALARLPEEQRSALVLREYQELEYREIGRILGCSEEAARARTYRARMGMRAALREWWEER